MTLLDVQILSRFSGSCMSTCITLPPLADQQAPLHFAWAGGLEPGQSHYYRIQGPGFLIEYDCTQDNANHIHTVWRDLNHDFGEDPLRAHYDQVPHAK